MKTEVTPTTNTSATTTTAATTTSRIVSSGAVVCLKFFFLSNINIWIKVPEETNQYDDIENRTKIMMRFMDDLTNIYFSTRNSLRLTVENGLLKNQFFFSKNYSFYVQMDHVMVIVV